MWIWPWISTKYIVEETGQMGSLWRSSFIVGIISLAVIVNISLLTYVPQYNWKLKIVHLEMACVNWALCYFCYVKFIRNIVVRDIDIKNQTLSKLWSTFCLLFIFSAQMVFFTKFVGSSEPYLITVVSWLCFGAFWLLNMFIILIKGICFVLRKLMNVDQFFTVKIQSYTIILLTLYFAAISFHNALKPPIIIK